MLIFPNAWLLPPPVPLSLIFIIQTVTSGENNTLLNRFLSIFSRSLLLRLYYVCITSLHFKHIMTYKLEQKIDTFSTTNLQIHKTFFFKESCVFETNRQACLESSLVLYALTLQLIWKCSCLYMWRALTCEFNLKQNTHRGIPPNRQMHLVIIAGSEG
jgi:hypothetical protein